MASSPPPPPPPTPSIVGGGTAAPSVPPASYHRGDPLDVPLIDDHLLSRLLLPRITNAIKLAFPQAHLDWTTGVAADATDANGGIKNALIWKKIIEGVLRALLLVGSCHRFLDNRSNNNSVEGGVQVRTPAMRSLGMSIRPSKHNGAIKSRLQAYGKVAALVVATVIVPSLYDELRRRRERQLEERERRLRLEEIRREVRASMGSSEQQPSMQQPQSTQRQQTHLSLMQQRARERRSHLQSLLADTILGIGDVFLPPLRLLSYVTYLWGMGSTPSLGMQLAGWEYAADDTTAANNAGSSVDYFGGRPHHRHANFQYGSRRLMVEEALRTVSMVLPPRDNVEGGADGGAAPVTERGVVGNGRGGDGLESRRSTQGAEQNNNSANSMMQRTVGNRRSWIRRRALSFMGVVEEDDTASLEDGRRPLACSMCHVENPTVPYVASCGHCYCYLCLRTAVTDDLGFRCADCGKAIASSARRKCPRP